MKPFNTNGSANASATDPSHWRDFETALAYHRTSSSRTDGIGFVFDPAVSIVGIDLDHCRDPETGAIDDWARRIVQQLDSYTEVSPSGTGLHVIVGGEMPSGRNRRDDIEMYDEARFFTVTGDHVDMTPGDVCVRQAAIDRVHHEFVQTAPRDTVHRGVDDAESTADSSGAVAASTVSDQGRGDGDSELIVGPDSGLHRKFGPNYPEIEDAGLEAALHNLVPNRIPTPVPRSIDAIAGPGVALGDGDLLDRAFHSKSGEKIQALYAGDADLWNSHDSAYPSQSEADMALLFYLAFWTGGDPGRMDRLFRESALHRGKWDRQHYANGATYGEVCIARTLLQVTDYYDPGDQRTAADRSWGSGADESDEATAGDGARPAAHSAANSAQAASNDGQRPPLDMDVVRDARRLANQVNRQQRELDAQRERIRDLEQRLAWYRAYLGQQPTPPAETDWYEAVRDIDPGGDPAPVPHGDRPAGTSVANGGATADYDGESPGEVVDDEIIEGGSSDSEEVDAVLSDSMDSRADGGDGVAGDGEDASARTETRGLVSRIYRWLL